MEPVLMQPGQQADRANGNNFPTKLGRSPSYRQGPVRGDSVEEVCFWM